MKIDSEYGKIILRISLSLVFLWFGINQVIDPGSWTGLVPSFFLALFSAKTVVLLNGSMEIIFGLMMISGTYLRFSSFVLGLHLFGIAFSLWYSAIAIRDFGLAFATIYPAPKRREI